MSDKHLISYLQKLITPERFEKFQDVIQRRTNHFTVVLEDVYQMHNSSAVIRSCDVFGVQTAHAIEHNHKSRLDSKIAMGAQKWVDLNMHRTTNDCLSQLKQQGYKIIATTPHNDSCYLADYDITQKSAFVFGSEKDGISDEVMEQADGFLKIPMLGFTESLNISVSAAIILQHLTNKLYTSEVPWQLTSEERDAYLVKWMQTSIKSIDQVMERYNELYKG